MAPNCVNQSSAFVWQFATKPDARFAARVMRHLEKHPDLPFQRRNRVEKAGKVYSCPQFKDRRGRIRHKCGYCWTGNIDSGPCRVCGATIYQPAFHSSVQIGPGDMHLLHRRTAMDYKISTLNKCNKIAATMNPKRYLSQDGWLLVEIIRLLLPESQGQPAAVCAQLRAIGKNYKWDMPGIQVVPEAAFLLWLVIEVAAKTSVPDTVVPAPAPAPAPNPNPAPDPKSQEATSRRRR